MQDPDLKAVSQARKRAAEAQPLAPRQPARHAAAHYYSFLQAQRGRAAWDAHAGELPAAVRRPCRSWQLAAAPPASRLLQSRAPEEPAHRGAHV